MNLWMLKLISSLIAK